MNIVPFIIDNLNHALFSLLKSKFFRFPIIIEHSTVKMEELPPPLMLICSQAPFNYTTSAELGFKSNAGFMIGNQVLVSVKVWQP